MPKIPNDMSANAIRRRAQVSEQMKAAEAKKVAAAVKAVEKPRVAKKR